MLKSPKYWTISQLLTPGMIAGTTQQDKLVEVAMIWHRNIQMGSGRARNGQSKLPTKRSAKHLGDSPKYLKCSANKVPV